MNVATDRPSRPTLPPEMPALKPKLMVEVALTVRLTDAPLSTTSRSDRRPAGSVIATLALTTQPPRGLDVADESRCPTTSTTANL